jgi:nitrite reductase/ring-hydroxylating ferredoxin subunit
MTDSTSEDMDACGGCDIGRRAFLRDATIAAAAMAAIGSTAGAMPVRMIEAIDSSKADAKYPIPAKDGVSIDKDKEVILARNGKNVYAFSLSCPHQNTALRWNDGAHQFQCPKHKSLYSADGVYQSGRATRSMDRFAVTKDGANIVVNLDKLYEEDQDGAMWKAASISV